MEGDRRAHRSLTLAKIAAATFAVFLFAANGVLAQGGPPADGNGFVDDLAAAVIALWLQGGLKYIVVRVLVNVVVAVAATLYTGEFVLGRTGEFLYRKLLPYAAVYAVAYFVGEAAGVGGLAIVVLGAIEAGLFGDLADNLVKLGLQLPPTMRRLVEKPEA